MNSRVYLTTLLIFISTIIHGQEVKVLHYTETSGFDHGTRSVSLAMFNDLGEILGFTVDDDQTGESFNSLENLQQYSVVVFSNTSGNQILNESQRSNFESYINDGGAYIGIHAASDTYRHSSANGGSTGTWDWYAEMAGASVQQSPNHTSANYNGIMDHLIESELLQEIPDPWNKVEEYYYWESGYYNANNTAILQVQSTGAQTYDEPRPMAWFKELPGGGRSFYTALGHAQSNYSSNDEFRQLISNALEWAIGSENVDCADVENGEAYLDDCGNCVGGTTGIEPCTGQISGSVNWNENCGARDALILLYIHGSDSIVDSIETEISNLGEFELNELPIDTFDIYLDVSGFLRKVIFEVELTDQEAMLDFSTLTVGDFNDDNVINALDFSLFSSSFFTSEGDFGYNNLYDINCDGIINGIDFSIFSNNYFAEGD